MAHAGGAAAGAAVAAAAAVANAVKASGVLVSMHPDDFLCLLDQIAEPLIVVATGGILTRNYQYLVGHKGLAFYTKAAEKLPLPLDAQIVTADKIWIPG